MSNYDYYLIERLRHIVHFENETRRVLNAEVPRVQEILAKFVGKQVQKEDYALLKKLKDAINFKEWIINPLHPGDHASLRISLDSTMYSIRLKTTICFSGGSYDDKEDPYYCIYYDGSKYLADVQKHNLTKLLVVDEHPMINEHVELAQFILAQDALKNYKMERDRLFYPLAELLDK